MSKLINEQVRKMEILISGLRSNKDVVKKVIKRDAEPIKWGQFGIMDRR